MSKYDVLVVDDDLLVCKGLKFNLEQAGYRVSTASTAHAAIELSSRNDYDVAILDVGLPDENGLDLCKRLKGEKDISVIFLTARRRELDEVVGLEVGADDYITKPFSMDVILARLRALMRRISRPVPQPLPTDRTVRIGAFELNPVTHTASQNGLPLDLAPREFDLLHMFMMHPYQVFTSTEIVESVWGTEYMGEPQVFYVQVRSLRTKIEQDPSNPEHILTLRGVGYKFIP